MFIQKLPSELLFETFDSIDNVKHLADIRLVCKLWGNIAEKVMLGKPIRVSTKIKAQKLIRHLEANPDNGKLIRSLNFDISAGYPHGFSPQDKSEVLALSFTPNIVKLQGWDKAQTFAELIQLKHKAGQEFDHLKVIPGPYYGENITTYYSAALEFRKTLQEVHIFDSGLQDDHSYQQIAPKLDEFTCLTTIHIRGRLIVIFKIFHFLSKCSHLRNLQMNIIFDGRVSEVYADQIRQFIEKNTIPKYSDVKELVCSASTDGRPTTTALLCFLISKFPSLEKLSLFMDLERFTGNANHSLFRICNSVRNIPSYTMNFVFLAQKEQFDYILTRLQSENHTVTMLGYRHDGRISLEIKKSIAHGKSRDPK